MTTTEQNTPEQEMPETFSNLDEFEHFELSQLCIGPNDTINN